jgi:signal peptidase II
VNPRFLGAAIALVVLVADQAAKLAVVLLPAEGMPAALGPLLTLTLRFNRGVSFSFLADSAIFGPGFLLVLTAVAAGLLSWWLVRARSRLVAAGLGAIIGGALGNAVDRVRYGAVVDYLDLHLGDTHFFVFNLADAAINIGVVLLLIDLFFGARLKTPNHAGFAD